VEEPAQRRRAPVAPLLSAVLAAVLSVFAVFYFNRLAIETAPPLELVAEAPRAAASRGFNFTLLSSPRPVPEIRFVDEKGRPLTLADFRGKTILLNIWATWCPPCRNEMPTLDRLQAKLGGPDFEVVVVSIDQGDSGLFLVQEFFLEIGVKHLRIYNDATGQAPRKLGSIGLPVTLLIDRDGKEVGRLVGGAEWDGPEAIALVERQLGRAHPRAVGAR
jgi:thiol-disulfide isomerase/thioredoxin